METIKRKCRYCGNKLSAKLHFNEKYCGIDCKHQSRLKMKRDAYNNNPDHPKRWHKLTDERKAHRIKTRVEWGRKNKEQKNLTARVWYSQLRPASAEAIRKRRWYREFMEQEKQQ